MAQKPGLLASGKFHPHKKGSSKILAAATTLRSLIQTSPNGAKERALLKWFGESEEHIALFALGLPNQSYVADYVAREITIKNFRADFACLYLDAAMALPPRLLLIEAQSALPNSLFQKQGRNTPTWGRDFLSGFAQVVDWHCFKDEIDTWPPLTQIVAGHGVVHVDFAVIAGRSHDVADALSQKRLAHWREHVGFGNNLHISTFDALSIHTESLLSRMAIVNSLT